MTKITPYLMDVVIEAQANFTQSSTALEVINKNRLELRANREGAAQRRTAAFVVMVFENTLAGKQSRAITKKFQSTTSKGTLRWTSAFASNFVNLNPDCACTTGNEESEKASLNAMLETFKKLNLNTVSDFKNYGVEPYLLSELGMELVEAWAVTAVSKDGPLSEDQKDELAIDLINTLAKHEKKNK